MGKIHAVVAIFLTFALVTDCKTDGSRAAGAKGTLERSSSEVGSGFGSEHSGANDPGTEWFPRLEHAPLDPPLRVTGDFGESRTTHFHAGLDFSTDREVGRPVYAPLPGWIKRVRASGVGYGRSLYLQAYDGRLLVFGHLDAFDGPVASFVASRQDSSGQFEQDLWPDSLQFRVRAGDRIAWSGKSGTGDPHLHFEIRWGDMGLNPLRAGLPLPDSTTPRLISVTLEPLDGESWARSLPRSPKALRAANETPLGAGGGPLTLSLAAATETVMVRGRLRATVRASDDFGHEARLAPWSTVVSFDGQTVECRFDSLSWATDMAERNFIYRGDTDREDHGVLLWAPGGFRPRVIEASVPLNDDAGVLTVRENDAPRTLTISVRDLAGHLTRRDLVLEPLVPPAATPTVVEGASGSKNALPGRLRFTSLPHGWSRVTAPGKRWRKSGVNGISLSGAHELDRGGDSPAAVFRPQPLPLVESVEVRGRSGKGHGWQAAGPRVRLSQAREPIRDHWGPFGWSVPEGALFEAGIFVAESLGRARAGTTELVPVEQAYALHPDDFPLRKSMTFRMACPVTPPPRDLGLYEDSGDGWEFQGARFDAATQTLEADSRRLGRFALFRDIRAPRIKLTRPRRKSPKAPYSRWALEAKLNEQGSGVDARESYFEVDGRRVPSEWDGVRSVLRWRPLAPPPRGRHHFTITASDRAGNIAHGSGSFVIN